MGQKFGLQDDHRYWVNLADGWDDYGDRYLQFSCGERERFRLKRIRPKMPQKLPLRQKPGSHTRPNSGEDRISSRTV